MCWSGSSTRYIIAVYCSMSMHLIDAAVLVLLIWCYWPAKLALAVGKRSLTGVGSILHAGNDPCRFGLRAWHSSWMSWKLFAGEPSDRRNTSSRFQSIAIKYIESRKVWLLCDLWPTRAKEHQEKLKETTSSHIKSRWKKEVGVLGSLLRHGEGQPASPEPSTMLFRRGGNA